MAPALWRIEADPNQLRTALVNLAINARDAMPDGGKLTVETANMFADEHTPARARSVLPGSMSPSASQTQVRECRRTSLPTRLSHSSRRRKLDKVPASGCSQVYGFVKQSGGHIKIYSEVNQGTTVKLYFPRLVGKSAGQEDHRPAQIIPDGHRQETILLVEDDPGVREYSTETLRELGYTVLEAEDGPSALRQIEKNGKIDLIFTDIGLPGMNGRQFIDEAVRKRRPMIKVLYTTAYAQNAVVHHGRIDPGVHLVSKPFNQADLATKIRAVIDGNES